MSDELLPCPFCGSPNVKEDSDGWGRVFHACRECKAHGPTRTVSWSRTWPDPAAWNRRAQSADDTRQELLDAIAVALGGKTIRAHQIKVDLTAEKLDPLQGFIMLEDVMRVLIAPPAPAPTQETLI